MTEVVFAIPGDLSTPTGGYGYDRRVFALLPSFVIHVRHLELPSGFPAPSADEMAATASLLTGLAPTATLLVDGLAYGVIPAEVLSRLKQRIVALVHHPLYLETGLSDERRAALQASERAALANASHVVVTSALTARSLSAEFAVPPERITIAEPGTDPAPRASGTGTPLQLLAVGAVSPRKAFDVLVAALEPLGDLDWRLTIAGALDRHAEAVSTLRNAITMSPHSERISLPGIVVPATLERFYDSADLFVMPSLYEGYGMVLTEALARGIPIVCTTGGAAPETVPDSAALKVPPGDVEALSAALRQALSNKKLRRRMADAAWDAGRALPTWSETARRIAAVLLGMRA